MSTKNVFYVEKEKVLRTMFEVAFKQKNSEIYTIDTLKDNFYLLEDLSPAIIVFDVKSSIHELDQILNYGQKAILVATGSSEDKLLIENKVDHFILKPIPANNLVQTILAFTKTR